MEFRNHTQNDSLVIESLFESVFTKSEGEAEGALISRLSKELIAETNVYDLFGFVAIDRDQIIASILFTRLTFPAGFASFILAPVAVHCDHQGKGIGQGLIKHGLNALRNEGVRFVITYGDPSFYTKVGFHHISHEVIRPPFELSQPDGWLGQSLMGDSIDSLTGRCSCVKALDDSAYW